MGTAAKLLAAIKPESRAVSIQDLPPIQPRRGGVYVTRYGSIVGPVLLMDNGGYAWSGHSEGDGWAWDASGRGIENADIVAEIGFQDESAKGPANE